MPDKRWETLDIHESFDLLASSEAGLTSDEARKRLAEFGLNVLAAEEKIKIFSILLHQFKPLKRRSRYSLSCCTSLKAP